MSALGRIETIQLERMRLIFPSGKLMNAIPLIRPVPWNKGKLVGQKAPLKLREIWAIRVRLQLGGLKRDLALFNLAIESPRLLRRRDNYQGILSHLQRQSRLRGASGRLTLPQPEGGPPSRIPLADPRPGRRAWAFGPKPQETWPCGTDS